MNTSETRKPQGGHSVAIYVGSLLSVTVIILAIAAAIGTHRVPQSRPLGTSVPDEGHLHVADFSTFTNQHHPPSSGLHYTTALEAGFYSTPVPEGSYVHNLEHGYVVILFKRSVNTGILGTQLQDLPDRFPAGKYGSAKLIVAPYDDMAYPVVALAWDRELPLAAVDRDLLLRFYQRYVDHGPEDVP